MGDERQPLVWNVDDELFAGDTREFGGERVSLGAVLQAHPADVGREITFAQERRRDRLDQAG